MKPLRPYQADAITMLPWVWRPVVGYEGLYEVSDCGKVRSVDRIVMRTNRFGTTHPKRLNGRVLRQTVDKGKYAYGRLTVNLARDGDARTRLVHHLVIEAFIGPRPDGAECAHNDGNPANNHISNLRWTTPKGNTADKVRHGTLLRGQAVGNAKLTVREIRLMRTLRAEGRRLQSIADEFKVSIAQVSRILSGKRWGHVTP